MLAIAEQLKLLILPQSTIFTFVLLPTCSFLLNSFVHLTHFRCPPKRNICWPKQPAWMTTSPVLPSTLFVSPSLPCLYGTELLVYIHATLSHRVQKLYIVGYDHVISMFLHYLSSIACFLEGKTLSFLVGWNRISDLLVIDLLYHHLGFEDFVKMQWIPRTERENLL